MVVNIPIRLVRKDSSLIPLNVTTLTLDVDRSINPHSLPLAGNKRFAFDMNMAKAVILLEGVITDDDLTSQTVDLGQKATATIDFSRTNLADNSTNENLISLIGPDGWPLYNINSIVNDFSANNIPKLTLRDESNDTHDIYFIKSDTLFDYNLGSSGKYHVAMTTANGSMRLASEIAGSLESLINSDKNNNGLSSVFTATKTSSDITNETSTQVNITQDVAGNNSNGVSPSWRLGIIPRTTFFVGGESSSSAFSSMSAGDKVMSLYGTLNNSNDGGATAISTGNVKAGLPYAAGSGAARASKYGDYIIGIQIPFNSTIDNSDGDKYVAKNFFMPTGGFENTVTKHPRKAKLASSTISDTNDGNETTFIKGAVTKATFVQVGGEPIYQFNIQFVPVDYII